MLNGFYELTDDFESVKIKTNYHTHTYLCGHAGGSVEDYVHAAMINGLEVLGMSDHFLPPVQSYEPYINFQTLKTRYLSSINSAKENYGGHIKILSAVEIEYFGGHSDYYKRLVDDLDYIVMGQHEFIHNGVRYNSFEDGTNEDVIIGYFKSVQKGLKTGFFSVLAHPDLIFYRKPEITKRIAKEFENTVRTAIDCGVALELNANGIRSHGFRYPTDLLIELCKKHNARVVVSSDCHSPDVLCGEHMLRLYDYAIKCGLNVTDNIKLKAV
ncbi:MAG: histidinol-phosphatase [Clostridiales bacterium]|nr:histidinol-phosphatase [Clostridiales bacterium]